MGFFVVIVRMPIGVLASAVLLVWSLLVSLVYCLFFVFLAIFGKLNQIHERLNPWLEAFNGVKCLPGLWGWVFRPYQGIFEEGKQASLPVQSQLSDGGGADASSDHSGLLNRYRAAMAQQQQQSPSANVPPTSGGNSSFTSHSSSSSSSSPQQ